MISVPVRATPARQTPGRATIIQGLVLHASLAALICVGLSAAPALAVEGQAAKAGHSRTHSKAALGKKTQGKGAPAKPAEAAPAPATNAETPASEPPPPPYEAQVLRLAEILGALTYLDDLCGFRDSGDWRAKMQALLEAEAKTTFRKERLAGVYNRSFRGYERSYRACTPNAQAIINRFLAEGGRLAHEVVNRFSAS